MPPNRSIEAAHQAPSQPVWDLPVRLVHWLLVALIGFSWWSAENGRIDWHIWSGLAILTLLVFRLLWGLLGSSTARFANFVRGPRAVRDYLRGGQRWPVAGHTPLGALSIVALLLATAAQVGFGLVATDEDGLNQGPLSGLVSLEASEAARGLHDDMFDLLLALIAVHVAAVLAYRLFQGRKLTKAMVTGRAELPPGVEPMRPARLGVAAACLLAALAVTRWVAAGAPPLG